MITKTEKNWIITAIAILVFASLVVVVQYERNKMVKPVTNEQKAFDPKHPNFTTGQVVSVSPEQIEFKVGQQTYTAKVSADTKFLKQTQTNDQYKITEATLADFKVGQAITVLFDQEPKDNVYQATRIQIF